jgi:hypothetical protein
MSLRDMMKGRLSPEAQTTLDEVLTDFTNHGEILAWVMIAVSSPPRESQVKDLKSAMASLDAFGARFAGSYRKLEILAREYESRSWINSESPKVSPQVVDLLAKLVDKVDFDNLAKGLPLVSDEDLRDFRKHVASKDSCADCAKRDTCPDAVE